MYKEDFTLTTAKIVYASMTGNNEEVASIIDEKLQDMGIETDMSDITFSDVNEFSEYDIAFMVPYSYGEGELPDEALDFYEDLLEIDLTDKIFAVAGSGDVFYEDAYCITVDDFTKAFLKIGGVQAAESLKINLAPDLEDIENIEQFTEKVVNFYEANHK